MELTIVLAVLEEVSVTKNDWFFFRADCAWGEFRRWQSTYSLLAWLRAEMVYLQALGLRCESVGMFLVPTETTTTAGVLTLLANVMRLVRNEGGVVLMSTERE